MEFKIGDNDRNSPHLRHFQGWLNRMFRSYAGIKEDGYYGADEARVVAQAQRNAGLPVTNYLGFEGGIADERFLARFSYRPPSGPFPSPPVVATDAWTYSAAGTSVHWSIGPQFVIGEAAKAMGHNHQPLHYPAAGFLGLGGTDPNISYEESILALKMEWARNLRMHPTGDIRVIGYSQSADGFLRAAMDLFGDGGEFASQRHRLKRFIMLGNPVRQQGPTRVGNNPKGWGISRIVLPEWLRPLVFDIVTHDDLYACATDDTLVPLFYGWFVKAETSLGFVGYSAAVVIPALASYFGVAGSLLGGVLGTGGAAILSSITGMALPMMIGLIGSFTGVGSPDPKLIEALSAQGLIKNIPALIKTLVALGGIRVHGEYHIPKPEFGGRTGIDVGISLLKP